MRELAKQARRRWIGRIAIILAPALVVSLLRGQEIKFLQHAFEARDPVWIPGSADAPYKETAHRLTDETAHEGNKSEFIEIEAQPGNYVHYSCPVGRAPVGEELTASLWVKANRPGIQLLARVVLPRERDAKNLDQPLTTLLRGDVYQTAGRWQRVELRKSVRLLKEQQQLLRAELKRDVTIADAYIDQLMLNVYPGPGLTKVWTDDLEIGPVYESPKAPAAVARPGAAVGSARPASEVRLEREQLVVGGKKFFLRGIRYSGTPFKTLLHAGFNTLWLDEQTDPGVVEEAVNAGFWLVPMLAVADEPPTPRGLAPGQLTSNSSLIGKRMARFRDQEAVLCYDLGGGLSAEQYTAVTRTASAIRTVDPTRPVSADIWDGFQRYSRGIDQVMLGVHRWPLMTGLELPQYRDWLTQRRQLAQPGTYTWTWIQTHLPEWYSALVYDRPTAAGYQEPVGPQPEQIRLLTYTALGAGTRGLGFWSDRFLADTHTGRDRLLQMALLNLEVQMLEPLLVTAQTPFWIDTSAKQVKAAVMRTDQGILCLPIWIGPGSQFVPGQAAAANLTVKVPQVPMGLQAWLVSPGDVRALKTEREFGGVKVTIPEFGLSAAIVFTSDLSQTGLVVRFQDQARKMGKIAAQWAHDLAEEELAKVMQVQEQLQGVGQSVPDAPGLLEDARRRIQACAAQRRDGNTREACAEAERALRPLRILMRAQWEAATKELDTATASPYAVSYYTLPRHWKFREEIARSKVQPSVLPEGDFEQPPAATVQWRMQEEPSMDEVTRVAKRVAEEPLQGKQCLMLEIEPKDPKNAPSALERTFLAIHSPAVKLPPGTLVRISGWAKVPKPITASADGALLFDSAGGEPLAVRLTDAVPKWKQFTLYRRVPASGTIYVTLALTGIGKAYFDDVRIEPMVK